MAAYPIELRERVVRAVDRGETTQDVAQQFEVSLRWVQKILKQRKDIGSIAPLKNPGGRKAIFQGTLAEALLQAIREKPDATLAELREACGVSVSLMCVFRALRRMKITRKKRRRSLLSNSPPR